MCEVYADNRWADPVFMDLSKTEQSMWMKQMSLGQVPIPELEKPATMDDRQSAYIIQMRKYCVVTSD